MGASNTKDMNMLATIGHGNQWLRICLSLNQIKREIPRPKGAIKKGQSRENVNIDKTKNKTKTQHNMDTTQTNINNVNMRPSIVVLMVNNTTNIDNQHLVQKVPCHLPMEISVLLWR